jgi:hypothetical protein
MNSPRLTLTKAWYGFSEAEAQVVLRAFENPDSVTPTEHLDVTQKPAKVSALIDRILLTAVIGDLLAETMRTVERQELRIARLEGQLAQLEKLKLVAPEEEKDDAATYNDGTIGPRVSEPAGPAV